MKVGIAAVLIGLMLIHNVLADIPEQAPPLEVEEIPESRSVTVLQEGDAFINDEAFDKQSNELLAYSASVMNMCTSPTCRMYRKCNKVGNSIICLILDLFDEKEIEKSYGTENDPAFDNNGVSDPDSNDNEEIYETDDKEVSSSDANDEEESDSGASDEESDSEEKED